MHLQAPQAAGTNLPARAIVDGTVLFASAPTAVSKDVDHAQNYNPFDRAGTKTAAWTDNGCVIVEHRTTIGAEGAVETEVVFYSLYMHLSALGKITPAGQTTKRALQAGDAIWRKDEIGMPGQIYGHAGQIHFEICFDQENLQRLIGRAPSWVEPAQAPAGLPVPTSDGRTDAIFGSLYFYLPANTPTHVSTTQPTQHVRGAAPSATTLGTSMWVKMSYQLGACSFESYDERGAKVGALPAQEDIEYDLYREATARHDALPAADRATSSPSGWYELLRFGRNIGRGAAPADKDPLPTNAAHWRRIPGADGRAVWADLNAPGSFKFSDADFLPIMGWNCIDDDTSPNDQRCDSERIKRLIRDPEATNESRMEMKQLARRLGDPVVGEKLRRVFCKFPSEWDKGTITARYGFVKELQPFKDALEAWRRLEAHLKGISFDGLPTVYLAADWRGHPRRLVGLLRTCGWLSAGQFKQLMPLEVLRKTSGGAILERVPATSVAGNIAVGQRVPINVMMRKHLLNTSAQRMASFFGNALQETQWLTKLHEDNSATRYAPWDGRGFLQLTWPSNYLDYWSYRGREGQIPAATRAALLHAEKVANETRSNTDLINLERQLPAPLKIWRLDVEGDEQSPERHVAPADSAGYYWSKLCMARYADEPHQLERIASHGTHGPSRSYYRSPSFWRTSACVNLPGAIDRLYSTALNGFEARCVPYAQALAVLTELRFAGTAAGSTQLFPEGMSQRKSP